MSNALKVIRIVETLRTRGIWTMGIVGALHNAGLDWCDTVMAIDELRAQLATSVEAQSKLRTDIRLHRT